MTEILMSDENKQTLKNASYIISVLSFRNMKGKKDVSILSRFETIYRWMVIIWVCLYITWAICMNLRSNHIFCTLYAVIRTVCMENVISICFRTKVLFFVIGIVFTFEQFFFSFVSNTQLLHLLTKSIVQPRLVYKFINYLINLI